MIYQLTRVYDLIDTPRVHHMLEWLFIRLAATGFLVHLLVIAAVRWFPAVDALLPRLDHNYLHAIYTPFSFILFHEVLLLLFALPDSHTSSIAKQYQIISLITIRRVFKDIGEFEHPETWLTQVDTARDVLLDMGAGVVMFLLVGIFMFIKRRLVRTASEREITGFINLKKVIALALIVLLIGLAVFSLATWVEQGFGNSADHNDPAQDLDLFFFPLFYECMIFTDVFLLIASMNYYDQYEYLFRNAGFVISTILLRFSLSTDKPYDLAISLLAMVYGIVVISIFGLWRRLQATPPEKEISHPIV